jgi:hypothetical protein
MAIRCGSGVRCGRVEALRALEGWATRPVGDVVALLDPDAVITPRAANGDELVGRDQIRRWLEDSRRWIHYRVQPVNLLPMGTDRLLVIGQVQWMREDAVFHEAYCVWSIELRDGLVHRTRTFSSVSEAGKAFRAESGADRVEPSSHIQAGERVRVVAPVAGLPRGAEGSVIGFYRRSEIDPAVGDLVVVRVGNEVRELPLELVTPRSELEIEAHALRCGGCGRVATGRATGWQARRVDPLARAPELALFCPECAAQRP